MINVNIFSGAFIIYIYIYIYIYICERIFLFEFMLLFIDSILRIR